MRPITLFLLAFCCLMTISGDAFAKERRHMSGKPPFADAYAGLLPTGMQPQPLQDFRPAQLRQARVALVPSANFNEWARIWASWYEEGGFENHWSVRMFGQSRETHSGYEHNSNPRRLAEQVVLALEPHVGEVVVARDLAHAIEEGADYFLVLDGWLGTYTRVMSGGFSASGGVYLLDRGLGEAFRVQAESREKRSSGLFDSPSQENDRASAQVTGDLIGAITSGMRRHLSGI